LGGMLICIFVGWRVEKHILQDELTNHGTIAFRFFTVYRFLLKYFAPIAIALIFLNELGLFKLL
ncbi:MAG: sodium-dependent transporter, partial [Tannerellaceae bacterium]